MKLATLKDGTLNGQLVLVSHDLKHAVAVPHLAHSLLDALQRWDALVGQLQLVANQLNEGKAQGAFPFDPRACAAPLPRSPQWLDGSAFLNHGRLLDTAVKAPPLTHSRTVPLMFQVSTSDHVGSPTSVRHAPQTVWMLM